MPRIFTITYDVANHQRVDPIFCLTVVLLCIILNLHYLSSHIVAVRPLESATQENYFPFLNPLNLPSSIVTFSRLNLIPHISPPVLRIFASTSVAKHRSVLPIFSLTIVSTWSYRERWISHRSIASFLLLWDLWKFAVFSGAILLQIQDNYHLRRQQAERSSHIRSDCSIALFVSLSAVVLCQKECVVLRARELSHSQFIVNSQKIHRQACGASCCRCRVTQHLTASHGTTRAIRGTRQILECFILSSSRSLAFK